MFKYKTCDNICMSETLNDKLLEKKRLEQEAGVLACFPAVTQRLNMKPRPKHVTVVAFLFL
jgi:hypothetical protein